MESCHQIAQIKTEAPEDYNNHQVSQQVYTEVGTNANSSKSEITKQPVTTFSEAENGCQQGNAPEIACLLCNRSYQSKSELKRHLKEKHSYKNFFNPEGMIQRNLEGLDTSSSICLWYTCQLCHEKFKTFKSFSTHSLSHKCKNRWIERMGINGIVPQEDGLVKDLDDRAAIQSHYMFTCTDCKALFASRDSYAMHRMMRAMNETCEPIGNQGACFGTSFSHGSKPKIIDRSRKAKQALNSDETNQRRLEDVTGEVGRDEYLNSILEKVVNKTIKLSDTGYWGFKSSGTSKSDLRVICGLCGTYCVDQDSLAMHVMSVHTGHGIQNSSYMTDHRKMIAVPKKPLCLPADKPSQSQCHVCGQQCLSRDSLAMHVLSHSMEQQTLDLTNKGRKREGFPQPLAEHAKRMYMSARTNKESFTEQSKQLTITTSGKTYVREVSSPVHLIRKGDVNASEEVSNPKMSKPPTCDVDENSDCDLCSVHVLSQHEREEHKDCRPSSRKEQPMYLKKTGVQEAQVHIVDKAVFIMNSQRSNSCPIAEKSHDQCFVQERPCSAGPIGQRQSMNVLERGAFLSREMKVIGLTVKSAANNDGAKSKDNSYNIELNPSDESQDDSDDPVGFSYIMDLSPPDIRNAVERNSPIELQDQKSLIAKENEQKPDEKLSGDENIVCNGQGFQGVGTTQLVDLHLRGRSTSNEACMDSQDSDPTETGRRQGQSLMCKHCQIIFLQKAIYYLHMGLHNVNNPWQCNVCGKECSDAIDFTAHVIHM